ncbi:MAG: DUF1837 domain-containing protein [Pelobacteraceae bacterium]
MGVNWEELLTVDCQKAAELFVCHPGFVDSKIQIRGYTIPFSGTQQNFNEIMNFLRRQLLKYVFPEKERPEDIDWAIGRDKFGDNNPISDGKLGEMLLYVFVEAFLKTPLMAYKLKDLGNPNDQVKGADGVFIGEYQGQPALLIGESKIHQTVSAAVKSAMESLQRFHENAGPYATELLVSRKYPEERELSGEILDSVFAIMNREKGILVHPVFIAYDFAKIGTVSQNAKESISAEEALQQHIKKEVEEWQAKIAAHKCIYPKPYQVYLDFFFLPVENSLQLRNHFYELLHGHPYESLAVKSAIKKAKLDNKNKSGQGANK